jgi:tight adherence protein C
VNDIDLLAMAAAILAGLSLLSFAAVIGSVFQRRAVTRRLRAFVEPVVVRPDEGRSRIRRWLFAIGERVARILHPAILRRLTLQSHRAGEPYGLVMEELLGLRVVLAVFGILISLVFFRAGDSGRVLGFAFLFIGLLSVDLGLTRAASARRRLVERDLPNFIDLVHLTLVAGLGLDPAFTMIATRSRGPLSDEVMRYLRLVNELGVGRRQALQDMALRCNSPEVTFFAEAVAQAIESGSGLVGTLQGQSRLLREARQRGAEANAQRAPIRMMFPMVAFILPVVMMIILGPVILRLMGAFSNRPL